MKVPGVKSQNSKCLDLQRRGKRFFGRMGWDADSDNNWLQSLPETEGSTLVQVEPHRGLFRFTINPVRRTNLLANVEAVTLLTFYINFQVCDPFALQSSPMKLRFWYLSWKHFPGSLVKIFCLLPSFFTWIFWSVCFTLCCKRYTARHRT